MERIISIREHPAWLMRAVDYFSQKWSVNPALYRQSMEQSLTSPALTPGWYLLTKEDVIVGGCGVVDDDFMADASFGPWLCALYVEPAERGKGCAGRLLAHVRREAAKYGVEQIYLNTDHEGFYEKHGWRYLGTFAHRIDGQARVYAGDAVEEMADFFDKRAPMYDRHMLTDLDLGEFYTAVDACFQGLNAGSLLDLGCGTGLELERLFARFPGLAVTGVDLSEGMLEQLRKKYPGKNVRTLCGSYLEMELGEGALTTHFPPTRSTISVRKRS